MNMKNYKKLVALSLTGALTLIHPETTKAAQYNNTINYEIVPKVKANKNVNIRQITQNLFAKKPFRYFI